MKKVVITGANGFVGRNTAEIFLSHGYTVFAMDLSGRTVLPQNNNLNYIQCDISEIEKSKDKIGSADVFIHFAWTGSAGNGRTDHELQIKNALTTVNCLKFAKSIGCEKFICAGSIMEYESEYAVHAAGVKPNKAYIYGVGKALAHSLSKIIAADLGIDLVWPMITNAYGEGENSPRMLNTTLRKIIDGEDLNFTAATQNYDFIHVKDVAAAFYLISVYGKPFTEYVIGSGNAKPLKYFIKEMVDAVAPDYPLNFGSVPFTGVNMPLDVFCTDNLKNDCGFTPTVSFTEGVKRTFEYLKTPKNYDTKI